MYNCGHAYRPIQTARAAANDAGGTVRRLPAIVLALFLSSVPAFAGPANAQYKVRVKVSDKTIKASVGDSLELTMAPESITAVDKTACAVTFDKSNGHPDCPAGSPAVVAAQFPPSAISEIVAGHAASFVSIIWIVDDKKAILIVEPSEKDFPLIVSSLEGVTGKKVVNADAQPDERPRVFLGSDSFGNQWNAVRNQSMEMANDFGLVCPIVQVTINQQKADFTMKLNHIERGLLIRDNQIEVYNKDGDLITGKEGGSISGGVKGACALIATLWVAKRH
jgi:hypothetical protein